MKMIFFVYLITFLCLTLSAEQISVTDAFGELCKISTNPERTVICYPSLLEIWLDCGGTLAGMHTPHKSEILPPATANIPKVGSYMHPNAETILFLKPNLVILSGMTGRHRQLGDLLRKSGIEVLFLKYDNYSDYQNISHIFSQILGKKKNNITEQIEKEVRNICSQYKECKTQEFIALLFNGAEFRAETDKAHAAYILSSLGGRNIVNAKNRLIRSQRTSYSREELLLKDPDFIFLIPAAKSEELNDEALRKFMKDPALRKLKAVRNKRLHVLPAELFHYKPNKRFPEAFRYAGKRLYQ